MYIDEHIPAHHVYMFDLRDRGGEREREREGGGGRNDKRREVEHRNICTMNLSPLLAIDAPKN